MSTTTEMVTEKEFIKQEQHKYDCIKEELKTNKQLIYKGIVEKIEELTCKYDHSFRISMGSSTFYYNCKNPKTVEKMLQVGELAIFTCDEKPGKNGRVYKIIKDVFYTF